MKTLIVWAVLLCGVAYGGAKAYLHSEVADTMDMAVLMMSPYADVDYSGVRSTMSGELTIENIYIRLHDYRDVIEIDRLGIDTPSFLYLVNISNYITLQNDKVPDTFGFLIEGLHLPSGADYYSELYEFSAKLRGADDADDTGAMCSGKYGFSPATLTSLGYEEQVFSMLISVSNANNRISFNIDSSIDDMWDIDANLTLAGDLKAEIAKGSSYRPRLSDMTIDYVDRSLNERVRKYCKQLGLADDEILAAQLDAFKFFGESNGIIFDEYLLTPYTEFLNGKQRITISAKPNAPIAMTQIDLYKASDVPALLNLEATAY